MEITSPDTLSQAVSLIGPVGLLFLYTILLWVIRFQKLHLGFLSFLRFHVESLASSWKIHDKQTKKTSSHVSRELKLSKEDVEKVMGRMGIACSQEGKQFKEYIDCDELATMFDEEEPSLEELKAAFCVFDVNSDGFIDAMELQRALSKLGFRKGLALEACEKMIAVYDDNRDGRIDFNEFVKFMESSFC